MQGLLSLLRHPTQPTPAPRLTSSPLPSLQLIDRCFGFDTAVEEAQRSLVCARVEAKSAGGISIVKLMGRDAGWIGLNASMASGEVGGHRPMGQWAVGRCLQQAAAALASLVHPSWARCSACWQLLPMEGGMLGR